MSYQLNGKRKYDIARVAQGVSVVHLYGEHLKTIKTYNPTLPEQQKIAILLSLLDERIATQNKIIDKLQSLIKGISNKIFATIQGIEYRMGNIVTISNGNSNVQDAVTESKDGLYPFFDRSENIKYLPTFLFDKEVYSHIQVKELENSCHDISEKIRFTSKDVICILISRKIENAQSNFIH